MAMIRAETFKNIFLLDFIEKAGPKVYGKLRLQKMMFLCEGSFKKVRPFTFKKYHYGPYSQELADALKLLEATGWVESGSLSEQLDYYRANCNRRLIPQLNWDSKLDEYIQEIKPEHTKQLRDRAYQRPGVESADKGQVLIEANLQERISVPELSQEDVEDMEISFRPEFSLVIRHALETPAKKTDWRKQLDSWL